MATRMARLVLLVGLAAGCTREAKTPAADSTAAAVGWRDGSPHRSRDVVVNGVRLNLLDWGGTGPVLMLIHGLGDSPHVFDDLAPLLTADFHVLAYARRGHGSSDQRGPYDNATLTTDLVQLLDSLGVTTASLLGWSMGGNEITEFAIRHPDRTSALIYLDAAYDWADPALAKAFGALPVPITPTAADLPSLEVLRRWFRVTWLPGIPWPSAWEAHLRELVDVQPDGSLRYRQADSVNALMFESLLAYRKQYRRVKAPALALYAPDFLPKPVDDTARGRLVAGWEREHFAGYREASIRRFRAEMVAGSDSVLPNTSHASIGVVDIDGLARLIRRFLTGAGAR